MTSYCRNDPENTLDAGRTVYIVIISMLVVFLATTTCIFLRFFIKHLLSPLTKQPTEEQASKARTERKLKIISIISIIGYALSGISWYFSVLSWYSLVCINLNDMLAFGYIFYGIGCGFLYIVFCLRYYFMFDGSIYGLNPCIKYYFGLIIIFIFIITCIGIILRFTSSSRQLEFSFSGFGLLNYVVNAIVLIILFYNKLSQLIASFLTEFGTISL